MMMRSTSLLAFQPILSLSRLPAHRPQLSANLKDVPDRLDHLTFEGSVIDDAAKMRLDAWLASQLPNVSRARVQSSIRSGLAQVNGQAVTKVSYMVHAGDLVKCAIAELLPLKAEAEDISLDIVYEDAHLLVVNKPAQMVTHPGPGNWHGTLVNAIMHHCELPVSASALNEIYCESSSEITDSEDDSDAVDRLESVQARNFGHTSDPKLLVRPGIVHRLDKGTSGLLVIAKDDYTHWHLSQQFKSRTVKRSYVSLTCGAPLSQVGRVDAAIARDCHNRTRMAAVQNPTTSRKARTAVSSYKVIEVLGNGGSALVEWKLETGRTHQIRVHAQYLGHPLLGDEVYGGTKGAALACLLPKIHSSAHGMLRRVISQVQRPCLHATTLGFVHPQMGKELTFTCSLPQDFERVWVELQKLRPS